MAGDLDLAGRIILEDAFSEALTGLAKGAAAGETAMEGLGQSADKSAKLASARIAELRAQLEGFQGKATGGQLTVGDLGDAKKARTELSSLEKQVAALGKTQGPIELKRQLGGIGGAGASAITDMLREMGGAIPGVSTLTGAVAGLAGPAALGALAVVAGKVALDLGKMGMESTQIEARFRAFSGGATVAQANLAAMDKTLGLAMDKDSKMGAVARIMGLDLASSGAEAAKVADAALVLGDAHESAQSRIANFTQMLASGQTRGLAQYGINMQEVKKRAEELRIANEDLTSQQATGMAIMEAAAEKVAQVKAEGGGAATKIDEFNNAWADLKDATAEKVSPSVEVVISLVTKAVQGTTTAIQKTPEEAHAVVTSNELANATTRQANAQDAANRITEQANADIKAQLEFEAKLAGMSIPAIAAENNVAQAAKDQAQAFRDAEAATKAWAEMAQLDFQANVAADTEKTTAALKAYSDAVNGSGKPFELWAGQMGAAAKALKELSAGATQMPEMPKNLLAFDAGPWQAWLDAMVKSDKALEGPANKLRGWSTTLSEAQTKLIASALAADTSAAGLETLSRSAGVAGGSIAGLVAQFGSLSGPVQNAIVQLGGFDAAIAELNARAAAPVTIDVKLKNMDSLLNQVDSMTLQLVGILSPERVNAWRDKARAAVEGMYTGMGTVSETGMKQVDAALSGSLNKEVSAYTAAYQTIENYTKSHYEKMKMSASDASSAIESALKRGLQVTDTQMFQTKGGLYKDVALESARQLDDIAQHGREAISRHKDWIEKYHIPAPLMETTPEAEAQLKAYAAQMRDDVTNLERPDLINWDAFIESFKAQVSGQIGKDATLNRAVSELKARVGIDLPKMSEEEIRTKVAQMLGMEKPPVAFKAQFEGIPEEVQKAQALLNSQPPLEKQVKLVPVGTSGAYIEMPVEPTALQKPGAGQAIEQPTAKPAALPPIKQPLAYIQPDYKEQLADQLAKAPAAVGQAGTGAAAEIYGAMEAAFAAQQPAVAAAAAWSADFAKNGAMFRTMGLSAGLAIGQAVGEGVDLGTGDLLGRIAQRVAPEVAGILSRGQGTRALDKPCF